MNQEPSPSRSPKSAENGAVRVGGSVSSDLLPLLRCPRSGRALVDVGGRLVSDDGAHRYELRDGVPDLVVAPARMQVDLPWYDPYPDLAGFRFRVPDVTERGDVPYGMDRPLASEITRARRGVALEIGCGPRHCEPWFRDKGFDYVGTDVEKRERGPHLLADAHNLPFRDESVDLYYATAVYQHLAYPLVAAKEAFRVLKPGGVLVGTAAFVYGFHDHASFHHMSHGGWLVLLRSVGFAMPTIWPDWDWVQSIPQMSYGRFRAKGPEYPWFVATRSFLRAMEWSFVETSNLARRVAGKSGIDPLDRRGKRAGSLSFAAKKPG